MQGMLTLPVRKNEKTRQDKTRQDKTKQNKTKQGKAKVGGGREGKARQGKFGRKGRQVKEEGRREGKWWTRLREDFFPARDTPEIHN